MVGVYFESGSQKVVSPLLQCMDDGQHFLLMDWVVLFCLVQLTRFESNWSSGFIGFPEGEDSSDSVFTGIGRDEDLVAGMCLVDRGETVCSCSSAT